MKEDRKWVCDASPIILLSKVGQADLLLALPAELAIPEAVIREVVAGPERSLARQWLHENENRFARPAVPVASGVASWDLGAGEQAVLSQSHAEQGWTVVTDDLAGRRCAEALSVPRTGTLGVVLLAKEEGLLAEVKPVVEALAEVGLRASGTLLEAVSGRLERCTEVSSPRACATRRADCSPNSMSSSNRQGGTRRITVVRRTGVWGKERHAHLSLKTG